MRNLLAWSAISFDWNSTWKLPSGLIQNSPIAPCVFSIDIQSGGFKATREVLTWHQSVRAQIDKLSPFGIPVTTSLLRLRSGIDEEECSGCDGLSGCGCSCDLFRNNRWKVCQIGRPLLMERGFVCGIVTVSGLFSECGLRRNHERRLIGN